MLKLDYQIILKTYQLSQNNLAYFRENLGGQVPFELFINLMLQEQWNFMESTTTQDSQISQDQFQLLERVTDTLENILRLLQGRVHNVRTASNFVDELVLTGRWNFNEASDIEIQTQQFIDSFKNLQNIYQSKLLDLEDPQLHRTYLGRFNQKKMHMRQAIRGLDHKIQRNKKNGGKKNCFSFQKVLERRQKMFMQTLQAHITAKENAFQQKLKNQITKREAAFKKALEESIQQQRQRNFTFTFIILGLGSMIFLR